MTKNPPRDSLTLYTRLCITDVTNRQILKAVNNILSLHLKGSFWKQHCNRLAISLFYSFEFNQLWRVFVILFSPSLFLSLSQSNSKTWWRQKSNWATPLDFRETANICPSLCPFHSWPLLLFLPFISETYLSSFLKTDSASGLSGIFIIQKQSPVNCITGTTLDVLPHSREKWQSPWGSAALQQSLDP